MGVINRGRGAAVGVGAVLVAAVVVFARARFNTASPQDFMPVYDSVRQLLHGKSIYGSDYFPYPPFATIFFAPLCLGAIHTAVQAYAVAQIVTAVAAGLMCGWAVDRRYPALWGLGAAALILKSDVYIDSLFLHNPTMIFIAAAAAALLLNVQGRGGWASAIIGLSVAVKPLLVLVWLVQVVDRRWRQLFLGISVALGCTVIGLALSHDLGGAAKVPGRVLSGTDLKGQIQVINLSLASVGVVHPAAHAPIVAARIVGLLLVLVAIGVTIRSRNSGPASASLQLMAVTALPVLGSISEIHYGVIALPALIVLTARPGPALPRGLSLLAFLVLALPIHYIGVSLDPDGTQLRWATGQTLALCAGLVGVLWPSSIRSDGGDTPDRQSAKLRRVGRRPRRPRPAAD